MPARVVTSPQAGNTSCITLVTELVFAERPRRRTLGAGLEELAAHLPLDLAALVHADGVAQSGPALATPWPLGVASCWNTCHSNRAVSRRFARAPFGRNVTSTHFSSGGSDCPSQRIVIEAMPWARRAAGLLPSSRLALAATARLDLDAVPVR